MQPKRTLRVDKLSGNGQSSSNSLSIREISGTHESKLEELKVLNLDKTKSAVKLKRPNFLLESGNFDHLKRKRTSFLRGNRKIEKLYESENESENVIK